MVVLLKCHRTSKFSPSGARAEASATGKFGITSSIGLGISPRGLERSSPSSSSSSLGLSALLTTKVMNSWSELIGDKDELTPEEIDSPKLAAVAAPIPKEAWIASR